MQGAMNQKFACSENMESQNQLEISDSEQQRKGTTFFKTCFNGFNGLAGIGILTVPYAVSEGGWLSLVLLFMFAIICWYTAVLQQRCMGKNEQIKSYPDIGEAAFGHGGRAVITTLLCMGLFLMAVELLILEGDNLDKLFPNMNFKIGSLRIGGKSGFVLLAALIILPTTWLRSLGALAYISLGGVVAPIILIVCVVWVGADGVGFHERGHLVKWEGLPTSASLFAFCFSAHSIMPTICNSMNDRSQFRKVLVVCFGTGFIVYGIVAVLGYTMFGDHLMSQITLNLPSNKISTKLAILTTVINPLTKYAIIITPIANTIEDKWPIFKRNPFSILIRTTILVSSVLMALFMPFFGYIMAFIGASYCVAMSLLSPCLCYLKLNKDGRKFGLELIIIVTIILIGIFMAIVGTFVSVKDIVNHL